MAGHSKDPLLQLSAALGTVDRLHNECVRDGGRP